MVKSLKLLPKKVDRETQPGGAWRGVAKGGQANLHFGGGGGVGGGGGGGWGGGGGGVAEGRKTMTRSCWRFARRLKKPATLSGNCRRWSTQDGCAQCGISVGTCSGNILSKRTLCLSRSRSFERWRATDDTKTDSGSGGHHRGRRTKA